jgi:SAM-dependent methyltransferase
VGCGTGLWTKELQTFGPVVGLDISAEALSFCKQRGIAQLVNASADHLPFIQESYRLITALGVIEHLGDDWRFVSELYRVCAPGGYVLLLTSAYRFLWSRHDDIVHHKRRYVRNELKILLRSAGFELVKVTYVNTILFPCILLFILFQRLRRGRPMELSQGSPHLFCSGVIVNQFLRCLLDLEGKLLTYTTFSFGVGLLTVARRPVDSGS